MSLEDGRLGLRDVVGLFREDIRALREDLALDARESEARVTKRIDEATTAFLAYQAEHLGVHNRRSEDTDRIHRQLAERIDAMTIVEARRAGALAVVLLIIRTLGTHWQLVVALVGLVGLLLGRIDIAIEGPLP